MALSPGRRSGAEDADAFVVVVEMSHEEELPGGRDAVLRRLAAAFARSHS
jgi:hypothetical protein